MVKIVIADYGGENLPVNVMGRIVGINGFKKEGLLLDDRNMFERFIFVDPDEAKRKRRVRD